MIDEKPTKRSVSRITGDALIPLTEAKPFVTPEASEQAFKVLGSASRDDKILHSLCIKYEYLLLVLILLTIGFRNI